MIEERIRQAIVCLGDLSGEFDRGFVSGICGLIHSLIRIGSGSSSGRGRSGREFSTFCSWFSTQLKVGDGGEGCG